MNLIGVRIKSRREELKYSQADLAKMTGISPAAISQYESGTRFPSTHVLVKLADVLKVTTEYILGKKMGLDIEDMIKDESVRALFRDYKNLSEEDKKTISKVIRSLKLDKEEKK